MITELTIEGLKAFSRPTSIPMAHLTFLTGTNSSGKSTAFQALQLLRLLQTSRPADDGSYDLADPDLPDGSWTEWASWSGDGSVRIGLTIEDGMDLAPGSRLRNLLEVVSNVPAPGPGLAELASAASALLIADRQFVEKADWRISSTPEHEMRILIQEAHFTTALVHREEERVSTGPLGLEEVRGHWTSLWALEYRARLLSKDERVSVTEALEAQRGAPTHDWSGKSWSFSQNEEDGRLAVGVADIPGHCSFKKGVTPSHFVHQGLSGQEVYQDGDFDDAIHSLEFFTPDEQRDREHGIQIPTYWTETTRGLRQLITSGSDSGEPEAITLKTPNFLAVEPNLRFHKSLERLHRLGPIRDDPKSRFPAYRVYHQSEVGIRGENVATVMRHFSRRLIDCPVIDDENAFSTEKMPLVDAVRYWSRRIGIATDVDAGRPAKGGLTIRVTVRPGDSPADLLHVGTGVSQAIPVIVLCLAAEPGSVILLEQPELHLHPALQSRMADFFAACALQGRQIVVETHSEHFVNRIRLLVARGRLRPEAVAINFFENTSEGTRVKPLVIDERGGMEEWPAGFFDESERTIGELVKARFRN